MSDKQYQSIKPATKDEAREFLKYNFDNPRKYYLDTVSFQGDGKVIVAFCESGGDGGESGIATRSFLGLIKDRYGDTIVANAGYDDHDIEYILDNMVNIYVQSLADNNTSIYNEFLNIGEEGV